MDQEFRDIEEKWRQAQRRVPQQLFAIKYERNPPEIGNDSKHWLAAPWLALLPHGIGQPLLRVSYQKHIGPATQSIKAPNDSVERIVIMAFAAARMIKEKKNLEAEHKKRSSDGLSKTKSKVISSHITSDLDIAPHTKQISYHIIAKLRYIKSYLVWQKNLNLVVCK